MIDVFSPVTEGTRNSDTTAVGYLPASLVKDAGGDFLLFVVFKGAKKLSSEDILENVPLGWGRAQSFSCRTPTKSLELTRRARS